MLKADIRTAYAVWIDLANAAEIEDPNGDVVELEALNPTQMGMGFSQIDGVESTNRRFNKEPTSCYVGIRLNDKGKALVRYGKKRVEE